MTIKKVLATIGNKLTSVSDEHMYSYKNYLPRFNAMYLDLFDDLQVLKQNISGIHSTLESELKK